MENVVANHIKRSADAIGCQREIFVEKNIPTNYSNIIIIPFFGDLRSLWIFSTFLLKQYKEYRSSKYIILVSWPGFQTLFPYIDEYWTFKDNSIITSLALGANNFYNETDVSVSINRKIIERFENVISYDDIKLFYNNGFEQKFWSSLAKDKNSIERYLPEVSSISRNLDEIKVSGKQIVVYPCKKMRCFNQGKNENIICPKEFWICLVERLIKEGFVPVIYQNYFTYDLSPEFTDRCLYLTSRDLSKIMCSMNAIGCVLDIHSGISRIAMAARCPFIAVDERSRFVAQKEYELDDLYCPISKQYIFSFSTMLLSDGENEWNDSLLDNLIVRLKKFLPICRENRTSTNELCELVSYDVVRQRKHKRFGVRFIRKY